MGKKKNFYSHLTVNKVTENDQFVRITDAFPLQTG